MPALKRQPTNPPQVGGGKANPKNIPAMFQIFQNVQYNVVQHKKYVKELTKLYRKTDQDLFRESFQNAVQYLFTFGDTSANVDRVIQFVATFCTSLDDEEEFLLFVFDIIFKCQCVSGQSVRYRASQLLGAVLQAMGEDASLDDDLCDKLLASQLERLNDTRGAVRCRAALALQRLQNPMDPDDDVTRAYKFHMSCDPSSSVRRAIVMSIAKCARNVPFVLERLCDTDEAVRRAAFLYISAINVTQLRVRQRIKTLKVGLTERSPRVRRVVEEILIPSWLSSFNGNIITLLTAVRLDNTRDAKDSQEVAGKVLESLFKRLPISELLEWLPTEKTTRLIPAEKLSKETVWYWRHLAEHLHRVDDDETLETVLPDLVTLTQYIKAIVESPCPPPASDPVGFSTRQCVLHELGCLLRVYDASDQTGRLALQELLTDVLTGDYGPLSKDVLTTFVSALSMVIPEAPQRIEVIASVISALREPPEQEAEMPALPVESNDVKLQRARLRVSLNVAIEAEDEAAREKNYALAEECKAKVKRIRKQIEELAAPAPVESPPATTTLREKLSDAETLNKCLIILNSALDSPQITKITPMLQMIFNELEVEIFQNPEVLENALVTVALYGMLDKEFAQQNKPFFFANLIDTSNESIVCTVLRCIMDILCVYGIKVFEEDNVTQNESSTNGKKKRVTYDVLDEDGTLTESVLSLTPVESNVVIEILLKIMDSTCSTFRQIIVDGLCRLLYLGLLESPNILCKLLLLWFNPATVDEDMLRQTIGIFFQSFASTVEGAQEQIQKATIPTLRALANAPSSSPISEIDHEDVVRFIASLTRVNNELVDSQGGMALQLCSYISSKPTSSVAPLVCRLLSLLSPPRDSTIVSDLTRMMCDVANKLPDKQSGRYLTRYLGALEATERASMKKMSVDDGTMQTDDTLRFSRATTSLPQPLARSTHVVINETVPEEVEIDETSPTDIISRISEEPPRMSTSPKSPRMSTEPEETPDPKESDDSPLPSPRNDGNESDSSGISPPKKPKSTKGKKEKAGKKDKQSSDEQKKGAEKKDKGVKRSRSQRSVVDLDRAKQLKYQKDKESQEKPKEKTVSPLQDLDVSNVTVRRSVRGIPSSSSGSSGSGNDGKKATKKTKAKATKKSPPKTTRVTRRSLELKKSQSPRSSTGSQDSLFDNSADETELHTIVYDQELVQSVLNDSSDIDTSVNANISKNSNVTIPETPDGSEIESDSEVVVAKPKGKRGGKKK